MNTAIILAGGSGSRMKSDVPKQYMQLGGRPLLFYSIDTFERCSLIDQIIIVVAEEYIDFCREEIVEKYGFKKVTHIVTGGKERYDSVYSGLKNVTQETECVLIHDGARACISTEVIERCIKCAIECEACVAAVPVKDTIKVADKNDFAINTPDRNTLWQIQTPQVFATHIIKTAYDVMSRDRNRGAITDDAMVVERYTDCKVKLVMGDYCNIKVTTPEDIDIASLFLGLK